jgi:NitT/TauT family transport system substrate-binding protein
VRARPSRALRTRLVSTGLGVGMLLAAGCAGGSALADPDGGVGELRLGYLPNVTHAPAIVGLEDGLYAEALDGVATLTARPFHAGNEVIEALWADALDAAYVGPNPAINGYVRSEGESLRVVAGTTSGGAALVVRAGIAAPGQLVGATLSTPALGNTQDVALRSWLAAAGYATPLEGGGEVTIRPQSNARILETFLAGTIDGGWVPEPWATRMVEEGGGHVLVDERDLWDGGEFVTAQLIVATHLLDERPHVVEALLRGHLDAIGAASRDPADVAPVVARGIAAATGTSPDAGIVARALGNLTFTPDPIAGSLRGQAAAATASGLLVPVDLDGIYDLRLLDQLLAERDDREGIW